MGRPLDVICLGRVAVDFYGQQVGGRLEDMQSFSKSLGGSSGNLAAGLARLGSKSSMFSRVGNEHMGRFLREQLATEGVDVSHVVTDPTRPTAFVVLGIVDRNSSPHIFFREHCADMGIEISDVDADYIKSSRALSITGTHLSTEATFEVVSHSIALARKADTKVILDIDYRPVLWGLTEQGEGENRFIASAEVTDRIGSILADCDILVGTEEEFHIAGGDTDTISALKNIRKVSDAVLVVKRGPIGCTVFDNDIADDLDGGIAAPGVSVEVLNTLGAGDAFLSGFLHGWLEGENWETCARYGNACGAIVVSRHACTPAMPTREELYDYLSRADSVPRPDKDERIQLLHRTTTRGEAPNDLCVLAFDHRRQLEEMITSTDPPGPRITEFKSLVCDAVETVAGELPDANLGVIVDERYGKSVLTRLTAQKWWIGRPVEIPGSVPVEFDPRSSMGLPLLKWPAAHIVKCLIFYHPDDDIELRLQQEERVRQLHADCAALDRNLLLEIISSKSGHETDHHTVANALRRFYNLGVYPTWWKLEPQSRESWEEICTVIGHYDPLCHGILLLGLDAPEDQLQKSFEIAAEFPLCRGFAVGRSIFREAAASWFAGELGARDAVQLIADNYRRMIQFWQQREA